jgi:hypothetical protein
MTKAERRKYFRSDWTKDDYTWTVLWLYFVQDSGYIVDDIIWC